MQTGMNACLWGGEAQNKGEDFDVRKFIRETAECGYDGVELNEPGKSLGGNNNVWTEVKEHGLDITALFASATYNPWQPNIDDYRKKLDDAAEIGVGMICVCGGFMGNQRRNTMPMDYDMFADSIGPMVEYASDRQQTIAFHPHRGCVVETLNETREILRRVPDLRICLDTGHLEACGDDAVNFIHALGSKIVYTHIKDYHWGTDDFCPLGMGDGRLDIASCIKALKDIGYKGWLTVELDRKWTNDDPSAKEFGLLCRKYLTDNCGL